MHILSQSEFRALSESASDRALSIYLPTHTAGPDIQQDPIRLKNLLSESEAKLGEAGMSEDAVKQLLKEARALLEDHHFWRYQSHGLALFVTSEATRIYRLPLDFKPSVTVADRFYLRPLLPLFSGNRYFYVLALSQNQVRFFQATRYRISEIPVPEVPDSLDDALQYDDPEKQLQSHSSGGGGGNAPVYHGQGAGADDEKSNIKRFFTQIDAGLHPHLNGEEAPLVVASVEYLQPIYREANTYASLLDAGIPGNPDVAKPEELREAAWSKVAPLVEQSHQEALDRYRALQGTGKTGARLSQLLPAAHQGQIETLFLAADVPCWGQFDPASGRVEERDRAQAEDVDLLDLAAVQTFLQGGTVCVLEADAMPDAAAAAAIYRYSVPTEVWSQSESS